MWLKGTHWRLVWPLSLLAILMFRERALALLSVPGMPVFLAAAILVVGLPMAWSRRSCLAERRASAPAR
jgi:hypothetical protein